MESKAGRGRENGIYSIRIVTDAFDGEFDKNSYYTLQEVETRTFNVYNLIVIGNNNIYIVTLRYMNPSTVSVSLAGHHAVQAAECFHCIRVSLRFTQITCRTTIQ